MNARSATRRRGRGIGAALMYWAPVVAYVGILFWLSGRERPLEILHWDLWQISDKWQHMIAYMVLGVLLFSAFRNHLGFSPLGGIVCATLGGTAYGILDEMHQWFVPGRQMDVRDVAADAVGSLAGAILLAAALSFVAMLRRGRRTR